MVVSTGSVVIGQARSTRSRDAYAAQSGVRSTQRDLVWIVLVVTFAFQLYIATSTFILSLWMVPYSFRPRPSASSSMILSLLLVAAFGLYTFWLGAARMVLKVIRIGKLREGYLPMGSREWYAYIHDVYLSMLVRPSLDLFMRATGLETLYHRAAGARIAPE